MRYPKLSEKIHSERNWLRCKDDWVAHAVELEKECAVLREALTGLLVIVAEDKLTMHPELLEADERARAALNLKET